MLECERCLRLRMLQRSSAVHWVTDEEYFRPRGYSNQINGSKGRLGELGNKTMLLGCEY